MVIDTDQTGTMTRMRYVWRKYLADFPFAEVRDSDLHISYQSPHAPELIRLSDRFHAKNRFCGDTELDRILSLMSYVHGIARKNGQNASPAVKNTIEIMKVAERGALLCLDYATVLAEMLLYMGIKAVSVSCLPNVFDSDFHAGVMAYLADRNKWAFFDPTFNTYFCDDAPMDIFEIRSAYANGRSPSFRHIDIRKDWVLMLCGIEYDDYDSWYSDYMLKNMFRFCLPLNSAYGCSASNRQRVFISPKGYDTKNDYDIVGSVYTQDRGVILRS
ncbi:MAG: transglutaminase family protein [Clostridiales bacterium]|nr:transglutaminase family protein [Clostridiales bacterium]